MMQSEFLELIKKDSIDFEIYEIIERVYTYHPAIETKKQIANLYLNFGMTAIGDMLPRAEKIMALEHKLQVAKLAVSQVEEELSQAKKF